MKGRKRVADRGGTRAERKNARTREGGRETVELGFDTERRNARAREKGRRDDEDEARDGGTGEREWPSVARTARRARERKGEREARLERGRDGGGNAGEWWGERTGRVRAPVSRVSVNGA